MPWFGPATTEDHWGVTGGLQRHLPAVGGVRQPQDPLTRFEDAQFPLLDPPCSTPVPHQHRLADSGTDPLPEMTDPMA